jgi:hypothetical protein
VWLAQLLLLRPLPDGSPVGPSAFGTALADAVRMAGEVRSREVRADADEAVQHLSRVSSFSTGGSGTVAALLGCALLARGLDGLAAEDLDRVTDRLAAAVGGSEAPVDIRSARELIAIHAWLLAERAVRPGNGADLTLAARHLERARDLLPAGHLLRPVILHFLGVTLGLRGMQGACPPDLTAGITALTEALDTTPEGHPVRAQTLEMLAATLISGVRFGLPGLPADSVISALAAARLMPRPDPLRQATLLHCHGCALHIRAVRNASREDFSAAMELLSEAVGLVPKDHRLYLSMLLTLASMLSSQYSCLGNQETLDAAALYLEILIPVLERAGGPAYRNEEASLCSARATRGEVHLQRAARHADPRLLDAAIADLKFALEHLPPRSSWRHPLARKLSQAHRMRSVLGQGRT